MEPARFGLCDACRHQKLIRNRRGSTFSLCRLGLEDPDWPKYPRMPVSACPRFAPVALAGADECDRPPAAR